MLGMSFPKNKLAVRTIGEHLGNIYSQGEFKEEATFRNFRIVQTEGKREVSRSVDFYNLDTIISVTHRVNSIRATQLRKWAKQGLREFAIKWLVHDKKRCEKSQGLGKIELSGEVYDKNVTPFLPFSNCGRNITQ